MCFFLLCLLDLVGQTQADDLAEPTPRLRRAFVTSQSAAFCFFVFLPELHVSAQHTCFGSRMKGLTSFSGVVVVVEGGFGGFSNSQETDTVVRESNFQIHCANGDDKHQINPTPK